MEGKKLGDPKPVHRFESTARAPPQSTLSVLVKYAMFRIQCFVSRAGYVIGKNRSVINQLKESTNSSILVEKDPSDSAYCVIKIFAELRPTSWVKLGEQEEEVEVSRPQHGLIRAFEVANVFHTVGKVSCTLLVEAIYLDALIGGERGKLLDRIREETGCCVDIFLFDSQSCAGDVLVKIQGNVSAVKKALVSISSRLQVWQSFNEAFQASMHRQVIQDAFQASMHRQMVLPDALRRTMDVVSREASYSRQYREVDPHDSLHRHAEISQEDALARSIDSLALYDYQRRMTQETLSQPKIDSLSHQRLSASASEYHPVTIKQHSLSASEDALARSIDSLALDDYQRPIGTITQEALSQPRIDSLSHQRLSASASEYHPVTIKQHSLSASKDLKRQVVLKILCSNESCVVGQEGNTIRNAIQRETGVSISVGDTVADCNERLITITATESLSHRNFPAQRAIVLVFSRLYETATENDNINARLVVRSNQIRGLVGKKFQTIYEIQNICDVLIQVLGVERNPKCVAQNNQVVQIAGKFPNVKEAINHVISKLLGNLAFHVTSRPSDADPPSIRPQHPFPNMLAPTAGYTPNFGRPSTMDLNDIYHHSSQTPFRSPTPAAPRGVFDGSSGLPSTRANLGLDSGLNSSNVTNTTIEFRVPENAVNFVFNQNILQELREVSGARIIVPEPNEGTRDRIIVISGTPHQIQSAQNILQNLI